MGEHLSAFATDRQAWPPAILEQQRPSHLYLARLYSAATGRQTSVAELKLCGERGHELLKLINARAGFGREDDRIPMLWLTPKVTPDGGGFYRIITIEKR
jgi:aldehyde:ferredoxin oxidoreductase